MSGVLNHSHPRFLSRIIRPAALPCLGAVAFASAVQGATIYTQSFDVFDDLPTSSVYFDAAAVYDGIDGVNVGADLDSNANLNGQLTTGAAQSGTYGLFTNTLGTTPAGEVWGTNSSQTITVEVGVIYEFSFYLRGMNTIAPGLLSARINGVALELVVVDGDANPGIATYANTAWQQHTYRWLADSTSADLSLFNSRATATGNDFYLDTITFSSVPEPTSAVMLAAGLLGMIARRRR